MTTGFAIGEFVWVKSPRASPDLLLIPVRVVSVPLSGGIQVELPGGDKVYVGRKRLRRISQEDAEREFVLRRVAS